MSGSSIIGVDVGGTFTDLFFYDESQASFRTAKVPSQRGNEAEGFLIGLNAFGRVSDFGAIVHGTTVGTNALLERKGARIGLITTAGFRDVLEMRRRDRPHKVALDFRNTPRRASSIRDPIRCEKNGRHGGRFRPGAEFRRGGT